MVGHGAEQYDTVVSYMEEAAANLMQINNHWARQIYFRTCREQGHYISLYVEPWLVLIA